MCGNLWSRIDTDRRTPATSTEVRLAGRFRHYEPKSRLGGRHVAKLVLRLFVLFSHSSSVFSRPLTFQRAGGLVTRNPFCLEFRRNFLSVTPPVAALVFGQSIICRRSSRTLFCLLHSFVHFLSRYEIRRYVSCRCVKCINLLVILNLMWCAVCSIGDWGFAIRGEIRGVTWYALVHSRNFNVFCNYHIVFSDRCWIFISYYIYNYTTKTLLFSFFLLN